MFTFISIMAVGAFVGFFLRRFDSISIKKVPELIHIVVCMLLFLLGISVGLNKLIIDNISYFCGQAAVISSLSILGSMLASMLLYYLCFKKKKNNEE